MRNLLRANLRRLWRDSGFWLMLSAVLVLSAVNMLNGCRQAAMGTMSDFSFRLDDYYFNIAPMLGLFCAVFSSLFLGTEYSDGTIRNKLVVGRTRNQIYLANLSVTFCAALLFTAAWLIGGLVGIPALGLWQIPPAGLAVLLTLSILSAAAFSAIFTCAGMLLANRAANAVFSMLLFLGLLLLASFLYNGLCEPELFSGVVITSGGMQMGEPSPNPSYIGGSLRKIYEFLLDFLPTGQGILMANTEIAHPLRMALSSAGITGAVTLAGLFFFRRKDLK